MKRKYQIHSLESIPEVKETLKQKLLLKSQGIRRFTKRSKFYRQNKIFVTDAKRFYREIGKKEIVIERAPSMEEVQKFWENIWSTPKDYNENAEWITRENERMRDIPTQDCYDITSTDAKQALAKSQKWKSSGPDKAPNFWLHHLSSTHKHIAKALSHVMKTPEASHFSCLKMMKQMNLKTTALSHVYPPHTSY